MMGGEKRETFQTWMEVKKAVEDGSIWSYDYESIRSAVGVSLKVTASEGIAGPLAANLMTILRDVVAFRLRELELEEARNANALAKKEADDKAARAEDRSRIALYVSWTISAAAVAVSVLALFAKNPVAPEVKALREELANVRAELVELRKAEERADHVIVVPGEAEK